MTLLAAFIAPSGYQTTQTTMRNLLEDLLPGTGPLRPFTLTPVAAAMQLRANAPIRAMVNGSALSQGSYYVWSDTNELINFVAAEAQPRWDAVVLKVADSEYGSVGVQGPAFQVVKGTAAGSPVKLSDSAVAAAITDAGAFVRIGDQRVPASVSDLTTGQFDFTWEDIYKIHEVSRSAVFSATGSATVWTDVSSAILPPITLKVPPTGKFTVTIASNARNVAGIGFTAGLSYRFSGGATLTEQNLCGVKGSEQGGNRATAIRRFQGYTPGALITITPQTVFNVGSGSDTEYYDSIMQAWGDPF